MSPDQGRFDGLVNIRVTLTPTSTAPVEVEGADAPVAPVAVDGWTVGVSPAALRIEVEDAAVLALDGRTVVADFHDPGRLLRFLAEVEVLVRDRAPYVVAIRPAGEVEEIQRRNFVRARVEVPVVLEVLDPAARAGGCKGTYESVSVDLSAGGARLAPVEGLVGGVEVRVRLGLPSGEAVVDAEVLESRPDGFCRLRFLDVKEGIATRITKCVFDAELERRRAAMRQADEA
ncbi:MAG: PilZ domain-containing protein [Actinomycetota bacterium]|nr:PilZ domain-containing protein [Actinomycetota bacterium]